MERALLLSLHPRFATAILDGSKTVELRRQRVAVPAGTPVVLYATSPVMALLGTARISQVDTAPPLTLWRQHRTRCGIDRSEYDSYMHGALQASALLLISPHALSQPVPLAHLRTSGTFHPPQSYRYVTTRELGELVGRHAAADELLAQLRTAVPAAARRQAPPTGNPNSGCSLRSNALLALKA